MELRKDCVRANLYFYLSSILSLFMPVKGHVGWFNLPRRWYIKPKELLHLTKLGLIVILNCLLVFSPTWIIQDIRSSLGRRK